MGEKSPKLLDLMVQKSRECCSTSENKQGLLLSCDEKKLELRLGLPCDDYYNNINININNNINNINNNVPKNSINGGGVIVCGEVHKHLSWSSPSSSSAKPANSTAVTNISHKRSAPAPVVGWPPIRSFRKNLASSSSAKASAEQQSVIPTKPVNEKRPVQNTVNYKGLFVKINMDGVPIGRKVDLNACNCYENLSSAVDTLFRGLLTALKDSSAGGTENKKDEQKPIAGLLDGSGEYTLVYEDMEGDRMLVGDVPWQMFVSTVKRLRVLKTSDLPTLSRGSKQGKVDDRERIKVTRV